MRRRGAAVVLLLAAILLLWLVATRGRTGDGPIPRTPTADAPGTAAGRTPDSTPPIPPSAPPGATPGGADDSGKGIDVPAPRTIRGVVLAADGKTPAFASLRVAGLGCWQRRVETDPATGEFRVEGAPSDGMINLEARPLDPRLGNPTRFDLKAGESEARILLLPRTFARLRLVDAGSGETIRTPSSLSLVSPGGEVGFMDSTGGFGEQGYDFTLFPGRPEHVRAHSRGYVSSEEIELLLAPGETSVEVRIPLHRDPEAPWLTLEIADETGLPPEGIMLWTLHGASGNRSGAYHALENGRVTLPASAGERRFAAGASDRDIDLDDPFVFQEFTVSLERGEKETKVLQLRRGGFLRLAGIPGLKGKEAVLKSGDVEVRRSIVAESLGQGLFVAGPLLPGKWRIEVPGARPAEATVEREKIADVALEPR